MRYNIVFKFLAIVLCAAALLGAVGSAAGIVVLVDEELYENDIEQLYQEQLEDRILDFSYTAAHRYAAEELGGANAALISSFYSNDWLHSWLDFDRISYGIWDAEGNYLTGSTQDTYPVRDTFRFDLDVNYLYVLSETPSEEYYRPVVEESVTTQVGDVYVYDALPEQGAEVYCIDIRFADGSGESISAPSALGILMKHSDGTVEFTPTDDYGSMDLAAHPVEITFADKDQTCIYQVADDLGVIDTARYTAGVGQSFILRKVLEEEITYDAIPADGCVITRVSVTYADGHEESAGGTPSIGFVDYDSEGRVRFTVPDRNLLTFRSENVTRITLHDDQDTLVYQVHDPDGAGSFHTEDQGIVYLSGVLLPQVIYETVPAATAPTYATDVTEATVPQTAAGEIQSEIHEYYNSTAGQRMVVEYTTATLPGCTVEVQLAEGALRHESDWIFIRALYAIKNQLPFVLIVSLLLFAITAVYLCCAAGRKPKQEPVRAGGLNRIPLDLYLAAVCCGVFLMALIGSELLPEIMGEAIVTLAVGGLLAYVASLLIVAFCFACAAQFKTPGGYWWRCSFCGFCLRMTGKLFRNLLDSSQWLMGKWEERLLPGLARFCKGLWKVVCALWQQLWKWVLLLFGLLKRGGCWLGSKLNRFYSLLPMTWQWLLVGILLVLFLFAFPLAPVYRVLIAICVILYGAHCFGLLLESAGKMSRGDLEEKVDDRLMTGAFKDFAGELNGLADVAVVAAQKQLKSERMKTELITNVSHDIKTPLTSIINYVDLLQKPHTEEEQEKYLEVLDRQSQRLKKLIDDLMEMSKASTGNLAVEIIRVDATEAVNQALGEFADKLEKAQLYPVFRQPETAVYMMADGRLVWRVMSNLLSNAVKYALPGTRLYVDLQRLDSKVILSLKNISREELNVHADELLERFVRGDASRNTEGSGLGLNIAQSLMELQKGQLQILVDGDLFKVTLIFPAAD